MKETRLVIGTRGKGRWVHIGTDDNVVVITAYENWGITDEVSLYGPTAAGLAYDVAAQLFAAHLYDDAPLIENPANLTGTEEE